MNVTFAGCALLTLAVAPPPSAKPVVLPAMVLIYAPATARREAAVSGKEHYSTSHETTIPAKAWLHG